METISSYSIAASVATESIINRFSASQATSSAAEPATTTIEETSSCSGRSSSKFAAALILAAKRSSPRSPEGGSRSIRDSELYRLAW